MAQLPEMPLEAANEEESRPRLLPRIREMISRDRRPPDVLPPIQELEGYYDEPVVPQEQADRMYFESMGRDIEGFDVDEYLKEDLPPERAEEDADVIAKITPALIDAIIQVESSGRWDAVSDRGAVGIMQVIPKYAVNPGFGASNVFQVANRMGIDTTGVKRDTKGARHLLFDPEVNREYGRQYLAALYKAFDKNLDHALVAYNWGPDNARAWVRRGANMNDRRMPTETRNYVPRVRAELQRLSQSGMDENDAT